MIAEYTPGKIYSFRPDDPEGKKDRFLDMKRGVSAFSFHPKYAENGYIFVFSHLDPKVKGPQPASNTATTERPPTQAD